MRSIVTLFLTLTVAMGLGGCSSTVDQRVSAPQVTLQQLSVAADGRWTADVRVQNYSNVPMQFSGLDVTLRVGDTEAGKLVAAQPMTVGPVSADITRILLAAPSGAARIAVADALAAGSSLRYRLEGGVHGKIDEKTATHYRLQYDGQLSPAPGLVGVLR